MHAALADSLTHLSEATTEADPDLSAQIGHMAAAVRSGDRMQPVFFALYYQLAIALLRGDLTAARAHMAAMQACGQRPAHRPLRVTGHPDADQLVRMIATEDDPLLNLAPVPDHVAHEFAGLLDEGFALMDRNLPDLRGEIDAIVHEVLLGHAQPGSLMEFDGASHYQYWGLLMLNPKHHKTPLAVVEVLAHECAHSLLFGLTIEEPLVLNPDSETFASPLRPDPRPMDGIYHATFVSARMAYAMERMADAAGLCAEEREWAARAAQSDRANFASGLGVVRKHGQLTATGQAIIDAAEAWVSG
jgi:HEXXH motif-containing protein